MMNPGTHLAAIGPPLRRLACRALFFVARFQLDTLGANPIEAITRGTGDWTLRALLITPRCRRCCASRTGWHWVVCLRRMLGCSPSAYGAAHLFTYLWLDQFFDWNAIAKTSRAPSSPSASRPWC